MVRRGGCDGAGGGFRGFRDIRDITGRIALGKFVRVLKIDYLCIVSFEK